MSNADIIATLQDSKSHLLTAQNDIDNAIAALSAPPPPTLIDMLEYTCMDPALAAASHMKGAGDSQHSRLATANDGSLLLIIVKNAQGYPWDIDKYDNNFAKYLWITEYDWLHSGAYKKFKTPLPLVPRFIDPKNMPGPVVIPNAVFDIHTTCAAFTTSTLGKVVTQLFGPLQDFDFGGDVGKAEYYRADYIWGNGTTKEEQYLVKKYGWVRWTNNKLVNGVWSKTQDNIHSTIAPGAFPLKFDCPGVF